MPASKHRKNRRAYGQRPLAPAPTLPDVVARGHRMALTRSARFDTRSLLEVTCEVMQGWHLLGHRNSSGPLTGSIETSVWERGGVWVGFHVLDTSATFPPDQTQVARADYLALMSDPSSAFRTLMPRWDSLDGGERVRRVVSSLKDHEGHPNGVVFGNGPVEFLDAVMSKHASRRAGEPTSHLRDMFDIVLHQDLPDALDPDSSLAAARTLAALGGWYQQVCDGAERTT